MKDIRPYLHKLNKEFIKLGLLVVVIVKLPGDTVPANTDDLELIDVTIERNAFVLQCPKCKGQYVIHPGQDKACFLCKEPLVANKEDHDIIVKQPKDGGKDPVPQKKRLSEVTEPEHERLAEYNKPENNFPR